MVVIVLVGPSGCGKTSLLKRLISEHPTQFQTCPTHTTRSMRPGEQDGVDYHFVTDPAVMEQDIAQGLFVESCVYNGCRYGLSYKAIEIAQSSIPYKNPILILDIQGVKNLRGKEPKWYPYCIWIEGDSIESLQTRLIKRGDVQVDNRLEIAALEIEEYNQHPDWFRKKIRNLDGQFDRAYQELMELLLRVTNEVNNITVESLFKPLDIDISKIPVEHRDSFVQSIQRGREKRVRILRKLYTEQHLTFAP